MTEETIDMDNPSTVTPVEASEPQLIKVYSVSATREDNVLLVDCDIKTIAGDEMRVDYMSRPDDVFGLNPTIRQWLADEQGNYMVMPYTQPTADVLRAAMRPITPRQLRLALVRSGVSLFSVQAAIKAMPDGEAKEEAGIEWDYASEFNRLDPVLLSLATALNLSPTQVDTMWALALTI